MTYRKLQIINPSFQDSALLGLKIPRRISAWTPRETIHLSLASLSFVLNTVEPDLPQKQSQQTDLKEYACTWKQSSLGRFHCALEW